MQHQIPIELLGGQGEAAADAVASCVHCGFCLPTCPTYLELGEEMDSPRGRILLMKGALEGDLELDEVVPHVDRCLGCLACVSACPSGVEYGELLNPFRAWAEEKRSRPLIERLTRLIVDQTLPYPGRFRAAARLGRLVMPLRAILPGAMKTMLDLLPADLPEPVRHPRFVAAEGEKRARVSLLTGCVQQVLAPQINQATISVLARNGVEVVIPEAQGCCGALSMHTGLDNRARSLAQRNLEVFDLDDVDAVVTNAAGCGSGIHEYPLLFADSAEQDAARRFADQTEDISSFLDRLTIEPPPPLPRPLTVAYHDACHLSHAQGVIDAPRRLLSMIPNLTLVPIAESEICCGSAGSYNIEQPDLAASLGRRKAEHVRATGAQMVVTGNIGCMTQIGNYLAQDGLPLPVLHTVELLERAYASSSDSSSNSSSKSMSRSPRSTR